MDATKERRVISVVDTDEKKQLLYVPVNGSTATITNQALQTERILPPQDWKHVGRPERRTRLLSVMGYHEVQIHCVVTGSVKAYTHSAEF